jgi:hypothetical protein
VRAGTSKTKMPKAPSLFSVRQVNEERREFFIHKLLEISRDERPRAPCNAVRGGKRTGETDRVLPASRKSAEPVKAVWTGTSAPGTDSASKSAMERETEPMDDAPVEDRSLPTRKWAGRPKAGGVLSRLGEQRLGGERETVRQPASEPAGHAGQNPHGVESAPVADERLPTEPENLATVSARTGYPGVPMIEATDDPHGEGRSLRSSPRTGKPSTWGEGRQWIQPAGRG